MPKSTLSIGELKGVHAGKKQIENLNNLNRLILWARDDSNVLPPASEAGALSR